jgi:hypothetical protein
MHNLPFSCEPYPHAKQVAFFTVLLSVIDAQEAKTMPLCAAGQDKRDA